ncbi:MULTISPECIES: siderophore-interacting protein [unclassified Luteimonas]
MTQHESRTVRHPLVFRRVEVREVIDLTPHMRRIVVGGPELEGFHSASPDDHIKVFFPNAEGEFVTPTAGPNGPVFPEGKTPSPARDYTPRHYDTAAGTLAIDFVLHGDGAASNWAGNAKPGDPLAFGGPRGSFVVAPDFEHYVMVADESALPAIARWLEEMPAGQKATALIEIPEDADRQQLVTQADADITWLPRNGATPASSTLLEEALAGLAPEGDTFWWIACESARARRMRISLTEQRNVPKDWIRATGYWKATQ